MQVGGRMHGQHDYGQYTEKQCKNHQVEGVRYQFQRGVELAALKKDAV